jgi:hypothetical protein
LATRARPCAARTRPFELIATQNRALRVPPPIAALLLLIRPPKIYKIYGTWAAHVKGFFFFPLDHMQTEDPSDFNILGSKLCTGAALIFFGFSFLIWFLDLFFLLFSSFYFLLIHLFLSFFSYLFSTILRLLILLFLYFKLFVVLQTGHSEGFFEGAKPLLIHLGSKLMYTV